MANEWAGSVRPIPQRPGIDAATWAATRNEMLTGLPTVVIG
jgi:hypothetical protein